MNILIRALLGAGGGGGNQVFPLKKRYRGYRSFSMAEGQTSFSVLLIFTVSKKEKHIQRSTDSRLVHVSDVVIGPRQLWLQMKDASHEPCSHFYQFVIIYRWAFSTGRRDCGPQRDLNTEEWWSWSQRVRLRFLRCGSGFNYMLATRYSRDESRTQNCARKDSLSHLLSCLSWKSHAESSGHFWQLKAAAACR